MPPRAARTRPACNAPSATTAARKTAIPAPAQPPSRKELAVLVNTAGQKLGDIVKAGWKARSAPQQENWSVADVTRTATECKGHIAALRALLAGEVDVERMAVSVLGKLVALELFEVAFGIAADIRPAILALYHPLEPAPVLAPPPVSAAPSATAAKHARKPSLAASRARPAAPAPVYSISIASLPLPSPQYSAPDSTLSTVIGHYLAQTLAAAAYLVDVNSLAAYVASRGTLLDWHPHLPQQLHNSLMRAPFQHIPKNLASPPTGTPPGVLFRVRTWALECLLKLEQLDYEGFWNQAQIFANMYAKAVTTEAETADACRAMSTTFASFVRMVQNRSDAATFIGAKSFPTFSQRWMQYAKKINDLDTLNNISRLMDGTSLSASQGAGVAAGAGADKIVAKISVAALQAAELMERFPASLQDPALPDHLHRVMALLSSWTRTFNLHAHTTNNPPDEQQLDRVSRALHKLRRVSVDHVELWSNTQNAPLRSAVLGTMAAIVESVEMVQTRWGVLGAMTNGLIDALLAMARAALKEPAGTGVQPAYAHLERAVRVARAAYEREREKEGEKPREADATMVTRLRAISGSLFNHGATMYRNELYGHAALYLKTASDLAREALELGPSGDTSSEAWGELAKRYELHGVCCFKFGDRKLALQSYIDALRARTRAYSSLDLSAQLKTAPPQTVFATPPHLELATLLDRTTYLASGELFLPGPEVSVRSFDLNLEDDTLGALVELQVASLEPSVGAGKEHARQVVRVLCGVAVECYEPSKWPVRRARVLVRLLGALYTTPAITSPEPNDWKATYDEVKALLLRADKDSGQDAGLAAYRAQYLATAHVWAGLLTYRDGGLEMRVVALFEDAAAALKDMLGLRKIEARRPSVDAPLPTRSTRGKAAATAPPKKAPVKGRAPAKPKADVIPVTPRPRRGAKALPASSSPAARSSIVVSAVRDDWQRLFGLLRMAAQLLGLLGHSFLRIQFLKLMRHLSAEVSLTSEEFVRSSLDLASEYATLGLVDRTLEVLGRARIALFGEDAEAVCLPPSALGVELLLLSSKMLAEMGEPELSIVEYRNAASMCEMLDDERTPSTALKIRNRTLQLERSALACGVFASIQLSRDNPYSAMSGFTQALRLWNRAMDNMSRLNQPPPPPPPAPIKGHKKRESNPFDMTDLRDVLGEITNGINGAAKQAKEAQLAAPPVLAPPPLQKKAVGRTSMFEGLQWRVAEGMLNGMFALGKMYFLRGSAREAQFFVNQALDFARTLGAPGVQVRALARKAEIALYMRDLPGAMDCLQEGDDLLQAVSRAVDTADVHRLHGLYAIAKEDEETGGDMLTRACAVLQELGQNFAQFELEIASPKKTLAVVKAPQKDGSKLAISPTLLATVLRHRIWLLRDNASNTTYQQCLAQFTALLQSIDIKGEHTSLMAKLAVHAAHVQLGSDLFLSSLVDSTIAIPMRVTCDLSVSTRDILKSFSTAETLLLSALEMTFERGHVCQVREAAVSLASICALQASLGRKAETAGHVAAGLLNLASSITLERELLDSIEHKTRNDTNVDDLIWPTFTARGTPTRKITKPKRTKRYAYSDDEDYEDEEDTSARTLNSYWAAVKDRHRPLFSQAWQPKEDVDELPASWTIVSVSLTEDKKSMFVSRQRPKEEPLVFCVPLERHNRRDEDDEDDEERLTYHDAMAELAAIIRESNEATARGQGTQGMPKEARVAWWAARNELDQRLKQLLDNIEYCWLGAFKSVLNDPLALAADVIETLRGKFENVFVRNVTTKDQRQISKLSLNPSLIECFLTLDPTCRDEELEDLVFFMLDLYQFNGVAIAAHDIDIDQVVVDLRVLLEESAAKIKAARRPGEDRHLFLVLDKNVQGLPWESTPVLRGRAVSRIPSIAFLMDRLQLSRTLTASTPSQRPRKPVVSDRALVNPLKTTYILNPSGDLKDTQTTFTPWLQKMDAVGWEGVVGRAPAELEMLNALTKRDLVIYFGHGGAEQYVRSHKIRNLPRCAATMLWGCSSGMMRDMGEFDRCGTPDSYMLSGCPTLVANLWDVTDRDIDRFAQSVFTQLRLDPSRARAWKAEQADGAEVSVVAAVAKARESCKLKYLTGAAAVVYGIPFYC
ncbi:hypothetical protein AURDEDRAFT_170753 [Auricularia subglabra TFB-10046 SS5]|uniref:separase n=1 Tax=Auricularia subglabra (strain TFB-10046 / SS5) TaxID=717982 RepID=J0DCK6_AURST|nr:hypothetical protein AURDEDRAFT_170753 [Auricularia subglabra TFB-10046 SS5]